MPQPMEPKMIDRKWLGLCDRPHRDLREFLERAERVGEVARVKGANWDLELGAPAEIVNQRRSEAPAGTTEPATDFRERHKFRRQRRARFRHARRPPFPSRPRRSH